jgi:phosphoglycolate phosphatase
MTSIANGAYHGILFDLDGTLVDTAPDMVSALQDLQRQFGVDPVAYDLGRSHVSNGALGLLRIGFPDADDKHRQDLMCQFIDLYKDRLTRESALFAGLDELLCELEDAGMPWGVVTNKPAHLTNPLLDQLSLTERCACIVSGDTLEHRKPHPAPLLYACELAGVEPARTMYAGDAARDIEAGRAADMATIAVGYGYITSDDDPSRWGAEHIAASTEELTQIVRKAVNLSA